MCSCLGSLLLGIVVMCMFVHVVYISAIVGVIYHTALSYVSLSCGYHPKASHEYCLSYGAFKHANRCELRALGCSLVGIIANVVTIVCIVIVFIISMVTITIIIRIIRIITIDSYHCC